MPFSIPQGAAACTPRTTDDYIRAISGEITGPGELKRQVRETDAAGPITVGVILGTTAAIALGRVVDSLLFGVAPTDVTSYVAAASTLVGTALVASYLPVRLVLRAGPTRALRG